MTEPSLHLGIDAGVSAEDARSHIYADKSGNSETISPVRARLKIFDHEESKEIDKNINHIDFCVDLAQTGVTELDAWFADESGEECGAYYVYVERVTGNGETPR